MTFLLFANKTAFIYKDIKCSTLKCIKVNDHNNKNLICGVDLVSTVSCCVIQSVTVRFFLVTGSIRAMSHNFLVSITCQQKHYFRPCYYTIKLKYETTVFGFMFPSTEGVLGQLFVIVEGDKPELCVYRHAAVSA